MHLKKVLVIGNGGREHAIIWKIKQSPILDQVYTTHKNFSEFATYMKFDVDNYTLLAHACKENSIDVVVVGHEEYLVNGIANIFKAEGILVFGPEKDAAKIEGSKGFAKTICQTYSIPTASYEEFTDYNLALQYIKKVGAPIVIKVDGLASGKGVFVCKTIEDAQIAIEKILVNKQFGNAGNTVIIEEFLEGEEISYFAFVDGKTVLPFTHARDYKQVVQNGKTYNTGGMGAFSPTPIKEDLEQEIIRNIIYPTVNALSTIGIPYCGILFVGIMLTSKGPKVLEYNARFGDPETQTILPRLKSDLLDIIIKTTEGNLHKAKIELHDFACLSLVMASNGYPLGYETGSVICNTKQALSAVQDLKIFNAAISKNQSNEMISDGGRVLNLVATGHTILECRQKVYKAAEIIDWKDGFYLKNVGLEKEMIY